MKSQLHLATRANRCRINPTALLSALLCAFGISISKADLVTVLYPHPWFPPTIPTLLPDDAYVDYYYYAGGTGFYIGDTEMPTIGLSMLTSQTAIHKKLDGTSPCTLTNVYALKMVKLNGYCDLPDTITDYFCWSDSDGCVPYWYDWIAGQWATGIDVLPGGSPSDIRSGPTETPNSCGTSTKGTSYYEYYAQIGRGGCGLHYAEELGAGSLYQISLHITPACAGGVDASALTSAASAASAWRKRITGSSSAITPSSGSFGSGGQFQFSFSGISGTTYDIQNSSDLRSWTHLGYVTLSGQTGSFTDTNPGTTEFYRVVDGAESSGPFGFVKRSLPAGQSLIANPLFTANMGIGTILNAVPNGTTLSFWGSTGWGTTGWAQSATYSAGTWSNPSLLLAPGDGALITLPSATTIAFIGEAVMGKITNAIPKGFSISSSPVPQSLHVDALGLTGLGDGDYLQRLNGGATTTYTRVSGAWQPTPPSLEAGEAVIVYCGGDGGSWNRLAPPSMTPQPPTVVAYYGGDGVLYNLGILSASPEDPSGSWRIYTGVSPDQGGPDGGSPFLEIPTSTDSSYRIRADQGWAPPQWLLDMGYDCGFYVTEVGNNVMLSGESGFSVFVPWNLWWGL